MSWLSFAHFQERQHKIQGYLKNIDAYNQEIIDKILAIETEDLTSIVDEEVIQHRTRRI